MLVTILTIEIIFLIHVVLFQQEVPPRHSGKLVCMWPTIAALHYYTIVSSRVSEAIHCVIITEHSACGFAKII